MQIPASCSRLAVESWLNEDDASMIRYASTVRPMYPHRARSATVETLSSPGQAGCSGTRRSRKVEIVPPYGSKSV
jgi:hypothetical protein